MREIIAEELDRHRVENTAREVAPIITALRAHVDDMRALELERQRAKLDALDPAARDAVEQLTRSIVNKVLHEPTVRVKDAAGFPILDAPVTFSLPDGATGFLSAAADGSAPLVKTLTVHTDNAGYAWVYIQP